MLTDFPGYSFRRFFSDSPGCSTFKKTDVNYTRLLQKRTHTFVLLCSNDVLFSAV